MRILPPSSRSTPPFPHSSIHPQEGIIQILDQQLAEAHALGPHDQQLAAHCVQSAVESDPEEGSSAEAEAEAGVGAGSPIASPRQEAEYAAPGATMPSQVQIWPQVKCLLIS